MNEPDVHQEAVHDLLHRTVDHFHASSDLAQRVERAAQRRRAARWSATGTCVLVAIVATAGILASARTGATRSTTATYTNASALPACAAQLNTALRIEPGPTTHAPRAIEPLVPGSPVAAVLCRYAGDREQQPAGSLAGSATITEPAQLARLQAATNAGQPFLGAVNCPETDGREVILLFAYPRGKADLTIVYEPWCNLLQTGTAMSFGGGDLEQLITNATGAWQ